MELAIGEVVLAVINRGTLMFIRYALAAAIVFAAVPAVAQKAPPPPPPGATTQSAPYLATAGAGDVFEITSSQIALKRSQNADVKRFASMLIDHHTRTTNATLAAAKEAGVTPPPPVLNAGYRAMIAELNSVPASRFNAVYLGQQVPAHQAALKLHTGYGARGDQAPLRASANSAVPIVQSHLDEAQRLRRAR